MSIDARIQTVIIHEDGSGELRLVDRPAKPGQSQGIAGQRALHFESAPEEVTALNGCDIWGGSNTIMLGEIEIAKRTGYTTIVFNSRDQFIAAIKKERTTT